MITEIFGWMATVFASICFMPQIIKIIRNKSTKDLSILMTIMMALNNTCWVVFGTLDDNIQVLVTNSIMLFLMMVIIGFKVYYVTIKKEIINWPKRLQRRYKNV